MACLSVASHQLTPSAFSLHAVLFFWSLLSNSKLTVHLVHCTSLIFINYHMENITFTATILYVLDVDNLYTMCPDTSDGSFPKSASAGKVAQAHWAGFCPRSLPCCTPLPLMRLLSGGSRPWSLYLEHLETLSIANGATWMNEIEWKHILQVLPPSMLVVWFHANERFTGIDNGDHRMQF